MDDKNVNEILKLTKDSKITMKVNENIDTYKFCNEPNDSEGFELYSTTIKNCVYGLSCCCVLEVIGILIQDYANGIIDDITVD